MPVTQVRALLVNNKDSVYQLIRKLSLNFQHSEICISCAQDYNHAISLIKEHRYDVLLVCDTDNSRAQQLFFDWLRSDELSVPATLFLTDAEGKDEQQHQLLLSGATDIIVIKQLTAALLERSIRYAIRHKADELRLLKLAHHDPLTGLANRLAFKNNIAKLMAQCRRSGDLLALMIIDLDNFKMVNDQYGHDIGDDTLIRAASLLRNTVRETDYIARLGGDEFAVIGTQLSSPSDAATLARHIINDCRITQRKNNTSINVTCSIGVSIFPHDGEELNSLLKHADNALLCAKANGNHCYSFADHQLNLKDKFQNMMELSIKSHSFLKELELYFQPIIDIKQQVIIGAEALLRWNSPCKGQLPPDKFLPIVESNGLMDKVGNWVLHHACMQQLNWQKLGLPLIPVSVNLTARQLENSYLINVIKKLINNQNFDPQYLCIELSEGDAFKCSEKVFNSLYKLRELGVHLTIDNFGKEYCSLTQLHRLPIDALKIDKSLIQRLEHNGDYADVTEAIIQLGKILNLEVIAHGIESDISLDYLRKRDCHQAQGYHIAEPLNSDAFGQWANQHRAATMIACH